MKKILFLIITFIFVSSLFAATLAPFILINPELKINRDNVYDLLLQNIKKYDVVERQNLDALVNSMKISYGSDYAANFLSNIKIADIGLVLKISDLSHEDKKDFTVDFRKNTFGNYIYYGGTYYPVKNKKMYSFDSKAGKFFEDSKTGTYVYLEDFPWAKTENEKYINALTFFEKVQYTKNTFKTRIKGSYLIIDYKTGAILNNGSIDTTLITDSYVQDYSIIQRALQKINLSLEKFYEERPKIALYIYDIEKNDVVGETLYNKVSSLFQETDRYGILDRNNLDLMFKELKLDLVSNSEEKITSKFKNAEYLVGIKINAISLESYSNDEKNYFVNPVDGRYVSDNEVEVGKYYTQSGVLSTDGKGTHIKTIPVEWERSSKLIPIGSFNDLILQNIKYEKGYINYTYQVTDLKSKTVLGHSTSSLSFMIPVKKITDRFGSYESNFESDIFDNIINEVSNKIKNETEKLFPIKTNIKSVENDNIKIEAGHNYGVKNGKTFRIINGYKTQGFMQINNVDEFEASGKIIRLYDRNSKAEPAYTAYEDFDYQNPSGLSISMSLKSDNFFGVELAYRLRNIYDESFARINFGYNFNASSDKMNQVIEGSASYKLFTFNGLNFEAGGACLFNPDSSAINPYAVLEINNSRPSFFFEDKISMYFRSYIWNTFNASAGIRFEF